MKIKIAFTQLLILLLILTTQSCKEIDKLTHFEMDYNETMTIPSTIGINLPFNLVTPDMKTNSEETFEINDTRKDLIEEIKLTQMTLDLTSPAGADFSFLKSIEIFIDAEGLDEVKIAWKYDMDNDIGASIKLETSSEDLKEYIKKDDFLLKVTSVTDELILSDHEIEILSTFFVDAKISGV